MEQKDYYEILGIEKTANQKQVKDAYRNLALKHHPDRNKGNPDAAAKMKEINESYAVLSHLEKRKQYDTLQQTYGSSAYGQFRQTYSEQDIFKGSDIQQIFEELSRAFGFRGFDDVFKESYGPGYQTFEFRRPGAFGRVFVGRSRGGEGRVANPLLGGHLGRLIRYGLKKKWGIELPERGKDLRDVIKVSPSLILTGGKIRYLCRQTAKELLVTIPPNIRAGQQIRLKGMGEKGKGGGEPGDLYIEVRMRNPLLQKARGFVEALWSSMGGIGHR
jgi:DnaJ-class molecular chaperone